MKSVQLPEMARNVIKQNKNWQYGGGGFRVLACADTLARTPANILVLNI
jgi:hypothetical protein